MYRRIVDENDRGEEETRIELASSEWKVSNPLAVTDWFLDANKAQSPDTDNGGQLRRIVRLLKGFSRSRASWRDHVATGFMITKLVVERYSANAAREDVALYDSMVAIRDRLRWNLEIAHPTVDGEMLTKGDDDSRAKFLREKLDWAIGELAVLSQWDCSREQALKAWDGAFNSTYFINRLETDEAKGQKADRAGAAAPSLGAGVASSLLVEGAEAAAEEKPVDKRGGGRYA